MKLLPPRTFLDPADLAHPEEVFVIIPSYNEGSVLKKTLVHLIQQGYSIVVVDDGSIDNTGQTLKGLPIYYLQHPINLGQGAAIQTGMTFALGQGAKWIVHFDADGQHRSQDIPVLLKPLLEEKADVALGSRFLRWQHKKAVPWAKRLLLQTAVWVNGVLTGLWLSDAHNGLRALSRTAAQKIQLKENGFAHATEIMNQIRRLKLRYIEIPTKIRYTEYSQAKGQSIWNAFNILIDLLLRGIFR